VCYPRKIIFQSKSDVSSNLRQNCSVTLLINSFSPGKQLMDMTEKINLTSLPSKIIMAILLFIISVGIFSVIAHEIVLEKEDWFDSTVFSFLNAHSSALTNKISIFFTFWGSVYFLLPAYAIVEFFLLYQGRKSDAIDVGILGFTSTALLFGLKEVFARDRPDLPFIRNLNTYSFPSGHALLSFVFFSLLIWQLWQLKISRAWKLFYTIFFLLISLLIGISRIVLGYHYASDVLAGFSLGLAYVILFFWLQKILKKNK
jgi:membrane-associated phospholipid phosphatase